MNIRKYIGIPFLDHGRDFSGCDCWGLAMLVYQQELGIQLPDLGNAYSDAYARADINGLVSTTLSGSWNTDVTEKPYKPLDVIIFKRGNLESHVGLWLEPRYMLHCIEGASACKEQFDTVRWRRMFSRVIRHVAA